jgi:hypothetical protein
MNTPKGFSSLATGLSIAIGVAAIYGSVRLISNLLAEKRPKRFSEQE